MNTTWYKISDEAAREALVSLAHMPSVNAFLAGVNQSNDVSAGDGPIKIALTGAIEAADQQDAPPPETFATEVDDVHYEYTVGPDGTACIVNCPDDPEAIAIPSALDGRAVTAIGPHAFCTCYKLEKATMPDGLAVIGEYAFMNTALTAFEAPPALLAIGKNTFYKCTQLKQASLNDGLFSIGESAFRESALEELDIPASVGAIGHDAFKSTKLEFGGSAPTLHIAPENEHYKLSGGILYALEGDKATLMQALDDNLVEYNADTPVVAVAMKAFAGLKHLQHATFRDGLRALGNEAFKGCIELESVELPDSVEHLGSRTFMDTKLASIRIPAKLETLGVAALYTGGSIARNFKRTIEHVEIAPGNVTFYLVDDILCQRRPGEGDLAVLYVGHDDTVELPHSVSAIGAYAFLNASHVRRLRIHDGIESIDVGGFDFGNAAPTIVYDIVCNEQHAGERYVIAYPPGQAGRLAARQAFSRGYFDLAYAYAGADNAIVTTRDTFIRSKAMLERLRNPVMLHRSMRAAFEKALTNSVNNAIVAFGRNGFAQGIDWLYDAGMIDADNIDAAIEAASDAGEIAVLSRLVELRRTAFSAPLFDFEL